MILSSPYLLLFLFVSGAHSFTVSVSSAPVIDAAREDLAARVKAGSNDASKGKAPKACQRIDLLQLEAEGRDGIVGPATASLCSQLKEGHFVVVRLPEESSCAIESMWSALAEFDRIEDREAAVGAMGDVNGWNIGLASMDSNEFLETRITADEVGMAPHPGSHMPSFAPALVTARSELIRVGRGALSAVATAVGLSKDSILSLLDDGQHLEMGEMSETVHRLCHYKAATAVAFGAHTDTTWFTVVPCAHVAGLEVHSTTTGWLAPETQATAAGEGASERVSDVVLMAGEVLQVFTDNKYPAAVHRVANSYMGRGGRMSAPVLLRATPKLAAVDGPLAGRPMADIHRELNQ